jgi:chloramphenicol 3-O-phosphotransferase
MAIHADAVHEHSVLFITGVPSSGKTSLAIELHARLDGYDLVVGDEVVRSLARAWSTTNAISLRDGLLNALDERLSSTDLIVDQALPATYVRHARSRFGSSARFVLLRLCERERERREDHRIDREARPWSSAMTALTGANDLYDLVLDTGGLSTGQCASAVEEWLRTSASQP